MAKLEDLRNTRMKVQPQADRRPSAQLAVGRLLRRATTLLEQPQFTAAQQTTFNELIQEILDLGRPANAGARSMPTPSSPG